MVLRAVLGAVFTAMAVGQAVSWPDMPDILGAYRVAGGPALTLLAAALIVGELVGGLWLLIRPRSHALAPVWVYTAVSVGWAALGVQAYTRGLHIDNCGCFGRYLTQPLSAFVLAQDALLLGYAALMVRAARRARHGRRAAAPTADTPTPSEIDEIDEIDARPESPESEAPGRRLREGTERK